MQLLENAPQGSAAWHMARATRFCASEAAAAMGLSKYTTRNELLKQKKTGLVEVVSPAKQRLFDAGHSSEAATLPVAERIAGVEFFPAVGIIDLDGLPLLASFDGIDMMEELIWENKMLNQSLVEQVKAGDLEPHYWAQLEHQLIVSQAKKALFTTSDANAEETHELWYESVPARRAQVIEAWKQFAADLATYVPAAAAEPAPVGRTPETLPALHIEVTGMVTASNLAEYKAHALAVFGNINRELKTDQDFASAESTVKWCADIEQRLAAAKQHALSQTESIDALFRTIDDISAEARRVRLELDKLVKARKEQVRTEIMQVGVAAYDTHIRALNQRIGKPYLSTVTRSIPDADFAGAIKGKRTIESLRDAVDTTLANAKIAASAVADRIQTNLNTLREMAAEHAFLFADTAQIVLKANDDLTALVKSRIADHQAAEEKKAEQLRESIRAEEVAKLAREQAERDRVAAEKAGAEAIARAQAEAAPEVKPAQPAVCEIVQTDPAPAMFLHGNLPVTRAQFDKTYPDKQKAPATPPTMALGEISAKLGFNVTSAFLATLGFEATTVKAAKMFHSEDFPAICRALIEHIESVCELQAA